MRLKDSGGKASTTLSMVVTGLVVLLFLAYRQMDTISLESFGTAWMMIVAPWIAREVKEAAYKRGD